MWIKENSVSDIISFDCILQSVRKEIKMREGDLWPVLRKYWHPAAFSRELPLNLTEELHPKGPDSVAVQYRRMLKELGVKT